MALFQIGNRYVLPGECWYSIDRKTLEVTDLGRGVRRDGALLFGGHYFISGCVGLAEFAGNRFEKISIDADHPLSNRATQDLPPPAQRIHATVEGKIDVDGDAIRFLGGDVMLQFDRPTAEPMGNRWLRIIARADEDECVLLERDRPLIWRLRNFQGERNRAGLTPEQARKIKDLPNPPPYQNFNWMPAQLKAYSAMYKVYRDLPAGPEKDKAGRALLDIVVSESQPIARATLEYNQKVRAIITDEQLRRLEYKTLEPGQK